MDVFSERPNGRPVRSGDGPSSSYNPAAIWKGRGCSDEVHTHCLREGLHAVNVKHASTLKGVVHKMSEGAFVCMSENHFAHECCPCKRATLQPYTNRAPMVAPFPFNGHSAGICGLGT
jgi:hypothetical protein